MLLERNGKLTMWKSKSSRLSYSLVESLPPLSKVLRGFTLESLNKLTSVFTLKKLGKVLERYLGA